MALTILADDLTGACDTGALFTRRAPVPVTVYPQRRESADVAVVDTESRSLGAARARERIRAAAGRGPRPDLWLKKVDSTLRGAVAEEIDALIREAGVAGAILCPAFPAQQRTVVGGVLRIAATPIAETAIADDPDFTLGGSGIVDALRARSPRPVVGCPLDVLRAGRLALPDGAIVVCDAERETDLDLIVSAGLGARPAPVLVGSAGLAGALARQLGLVGEPPPIASGLRWLILAGSLHPATAAQVTAARAEGARIVTPPTTVAADRPAVAAELARQARKIIETEPVDLVAVTGGDTAAALYREFDAERIDLVGAPGPGLALGRLRAGDGRELTLLTKAGGFGAADLFVRLM
jgi:D-threonate/D-erythronate kinase